MHGGLVFGRPDPPCPPIAPPEPARSGSLPAFDQVKAAWQPSDALLLDRHGQPVQALRTDFRQRRLAWTSLAEISPAMRQALLLSEDQRFYEHAGVDWRGVGAAAWANLWHGRTRGASTVTMQLAGLLDSGLAAPAGGRSIGRKLGQAATALRLERQWRKDQILEAYLNLVGFRGELVGIRALSQAVFRKHPSGLDARESALAAALVRSPQAPPQAVADRACGVLLRMAAPAVVGTHSQRKQQCHGLAEQARHLLAAPHGGRLDDDPQLAPHLARRLLVPGGPAELRSSLDAYLQRQARDILRRHLAELRGHQVQDGAVLVLDNASGEVRAWVGSSGTLSQAAEVDGVTALRQAGSTLKPFLYGLALERRWLTPASLLDDSPVNLSTAAGLYLPDNYDHRYKGRVSLRTALAASLNVPAVRTLVMVTPTAFHRRLVALGLPLREQGDYYGYSLALGSPEVSLLSLANAYRTLANAGRHGPVRFRPQHDTAQAAHPAAPTDSPRQLLDPAAAWLVADMLADREARVPTFGLDNALATRYWAAVKTGTSKDMRDNWCVGFSRRYTVAVWVGNASGEPMWDVSGTTGAAPVWRAVMDALYQRERPSAWSAPPPPRELVQRTLRYADATEPARQEWFLPGTEPNAPLARAGAPRVAGSLIRSPADGSVLALDPDIPPAAQKLVMQAVAGLPRAWAWRLNGQRLGSAARQLQWALWPGRHRLELVDATGRVRDHVGFEVRGAAVAHPGPHRAALRP